MLLVGGLLVATVPSTADAQDPGDCPVPADMAFEQEYIDTSRAGGEPIMTLHPDGNLLWGSHAGTTHFFTPGAPDPDTAAFLQNYQGQTYYYFSDDDGQTFQFVPRLPFTGDNLVGGVPNSGFSDPEFAIDAAGNVFVSEINLANIAVSKSTDGGRSYELQNVVSVVLTDRQWTEADEEDVLYMSGNSFGGGPFPNPTTTSPTGHFLAKSTDGGVTFVAENPNPDGAGDLQINRETGDIYELAVTGSTIEMVVYRGIRDADSGFGDLVEKTLITDNVSLDGIEQLIAVTFDIDEAGNLYAVWPDRGVTGNEPGIWYAYSTDDNETWSDPVRISEGDGTTIWPWVTSTSAGKASVVWLQTGRALDGHSAENASPDDQWHVMHAASISALGCDTSEVATFNVQQASDEAPHSGTVCVGGTLCQAELVDRRLGDYFDNEFNAAGQVVIAVSDTRQGGAVSLPLVIRQTSGPLLAPNLRDPSAPAPEPAPPAPAPEPAPEPEPAPAPLPATGGGLAAAALGLALLARRR